MEGKRLIEEVRKLSADLKREHDASTVNAYIDRFYDLLREAKATWPNVGRLGIIPRPRKVGENEPEIEATTQMGILKSAAGQLNIMVDRKAA